MGARNLKALLENFRVCFDLISFTRHCRTQDGDDEGEDEEEVEERAEHYERSRSVVICEGVVEGGTTTRMYDEGRWRGG